jgi:hypothetical protein
MRIGADSDEKKDPADFRRVFFLVLSDVRYLILMITSWLETPFREITSL